MFLDRIRVRKGGSYALLKTVGVRGLALLSAFLLSTFIARWLTPADAGTFFLLYALLAIFATLGRFGTDNLSLRILGGDSKTPRSDVKSLMAIAAVCGSLATVISVPFVYFLGGFGGSLLTVALSSCVLSQALACVSGTVLRGLGKLGSGITAELGSLPIIALIVLVPIDRYHPSGVSLTVAVIALCAGSWATVLWSFPVAMLALRRTFNAEEPTAKAPFEFWLAHFRQLAPMMGTSVLVYAVVWAPAFVLSAVSTRSEVAYYSVALRLANLVALIPSVQISYLAPEFARRYYSPDLAGLNALTSKTTLQVAIVTFLPAFVLAVFAPHVIEMLFGAEYLPASTITMILTGAAYVVLLFGQVNQLMLLCGLQKQSMIFTMCALAVWLTFGLFASREFGAIGAAGVAAVTSITYATAGALSLQRMKGIKSHLVI